MTAMVSENPDAWAARINECWRASVDAILEVGRLLQGAKENLPHGAFTTMVETQLPFGPRTARMLMSVVADARLTNRKHASVLPPSWATLYELTKLDDEQFEARIADGTICPEMQRQDVATVVKKIARKAKEQALGQKQRALPSEKFGVILADPEWKHLPWSDAGMMKSADNHYTTTATDEIAARPVADIAADDCVLFLWGTVPMLPDALKVMDAWGFKYRSSAVWKKQYVGDRHGMGYWFRIDHELLLVGTKGNIPAPAPGTQWVSVIEAPAGEHSAKPEAVLEMIEAYFPTLPKIELNRRGCARPGWSAWGNEADDPHTGEITQEDAA